VQAIHAPLCCIPLSEAQVPRAPRSHTTITTVPVSRLPARWTLLADPTPSAMCLVRIASPFCFLVLMCRMGLEWSLFCVVSIYELGQVLLSSAGPKRFRVLSPGLRTIPYWFLDFLLADYRPKWGPFQSFLPPNLPLAHTVFSSLSTVVVLVDASLA
jgi:hypothetical protein